MYLRNGLHIMLSRRRDSVVSVQHDASTAPRAHGTGDGMPTPAQSNDDLQASQRRPVSPGARIPVTSSPQAFNSFDFARNDECQNPFVGANAMSQHATVSPITSLHELQAELDRWHQYAGFLQSIRQQLDALQSSNTHYTGVHVLLEGDWNLAVIQTDLQQTLTQKALNLEIPLEALKVEIARISGPCRPVHSTIMSDHTDEEFESPRWNIPPLLEEYLVSKGQVRIYEERIYEHEIQRLESMDVRQRHEDQELLPDEWHERFLETYDAKLLVIEADLRAAETVRDNALKLCLEAGIDVNAPIQPDSNVPSEAGDHPEKQEGPSDAEQKELLELAQQVMVKEAPLGSVLESGNLSSGPPPSRAQEWLQQQQSAAQMDIDAAVTNAPVKKD